MAYQASQSQKVCFRALLPFGPGPYSISVKILFKVDVLKPLQIEIKLRAKEVYLILLNVHIVFGKGKHLGCKSIAGVKTEFPVHSSDEPTEIRSMVYSISI